MLSTIKNDPDWEGQIDIKYQDITEYIDIKEIKVESVDSQEFKMKMEECNVDEDLEDVPQECIKDNKDINRRDNENFDCSDDKCFSRSIGILALKNSLDCQYSGYNGVTNMDDPVMVVHSEENECSSADLNIPWHINSIHTKEEICKCEYCDYGSPLLSNLKRHIKSKHTRQKLNKCDYCDYESAHMSHLKRHINSIHTREKIHKCQYCDYESTQMLTLKRHINSKHTREKLHKCEYCDYGFPQISTLKSHINSKHSREEIHKCEYCDYESPDKSNLKRHINSKHTREKLHKCEYCDYGSPEMSHLKRHMKCKHTEVRRLNVQENIKT